MQVAGEPAAMMVVVAGASRTYPGETVCGDGWTVQDRQDTCQIAVIDGLGHGAPAADAMERARAALAVRDGPDPVAALTRCHQALRGTRGAAISIASIDTERRILRYAGVGNVEAQLWQGGTTQRLIAYRGIVGVTYRTVRAFDIDLEASWWLMLTTDGVRSRATVEELIGLLAQSPQAAADAALERWARSTDDATVVVAGPAPAGRMEQPENGRPP